MKTYKINITGKVQGVFFRANTLRVAQSLLLKGIVKNCKNGNVEILAQGNIDSIFELINWCKKGPKLAKVSDVIYEEIASQNFNDFRIEN